MYDVGILGGMGPKATAMLFQQLVDRTLAYSDQDHLSVAVVNKSGIPDRSAYLLGFSEDSPLPMLAEGIRELDALGAKYILMPCNTAHYFYPQLKECARGHIINMVANALHYIAECSLPDRVYILGTLGTVRTGIYERYNSYGLTLCYPTDEECRGIHRIIYEVKERRTALPMLARDFAGIINTIRQRENRITFAIACTELSCLYPLLPEKDCVVDVMALSALAAISLSGAVPLSSQGYDVDVLSTVAREDAHGE